MSPLAALNKLKRVREELSQPRNFYVATQSDFVETARQVLSDTLANLRPDGVAPDLWTGQVAVLAARIVGKLTAEPGLEISLAAESVPYVGAGGEERVSKADAEAWVTAGHGKQGATDPGKNLDERDAGKTDSQIAWRIIGAINKGNKSLEAAVREFAGLAAGSEAVALLGEVLKAWYEIIRPQAEAEWTAWVRKKAGGGAGGMEKASPFTEDFRAMMADIGVVLP